MTHGVLESELVTLHALLSVPTGPTIVAKHGQVCRRNGKKKTVAGGRNKWNQYTIATDYINIAGQDFKDTLQVTTVTKTLERIDVSDCRTAEKGGSSDSFEHGQRWRRDD